MEPRLEAIRHARGDNYGLITALVYVGDQLGELADTYREAKTAATPPPYPHFVAIPTPDAIRDSRYPAPEFVPGEFRL